MKKAVGGSPVKYRVAVSILKRHVLPTAAAITAA